MVIEIKYVDNYPKHRGWTMFDIEYYSTYTIFYKFPPLNFLHIEDAWPAVNDDGDIIWTLNSDFMTVIPHKYVTKFEKKR